MARKARHQSKTHLKAGSPVVMEMHANLCCAELPRQVKLSRALRMEKSRRSSLCLYFTFPLFTFFIILNIKSFFPTYTLYIHTCLLFSLVNVLLIRTLWRHIYFLHLLSCVCPYSCHRACAVCPAGLWWRCPVAPSSRCGSSTASDPNDSEASHYCETQGNMNTQTRHQLWPVTTLTHIIKNKYCIAAR